MRRLGLAEFRWRAFDGGSRDVRLNGTLCAYCLTRPADTRDHVIPRARGGRGGREYNLVPACRECNTAKGSLTVFGWLPKLQRLELQRARRQAKKRHKRKKWRRNRAARRAGILVA